MFQHIKETRHAVHISVTSTDFGVSKSTDNGRRKGKRKKWSWDCNLAVPVSK